MVPDLPSNPLPLRVLRLLSQERMLAYAQIAPDLTIACATENFGETISSPDANGGPIEGKHIGDLFLELAVADRDLKAILNGSSSGYLIENVNREQPNGEIRYLTFHIVPLDEANPGCGLLLTVEDNSYIGALEQMLVQERNTLRLTQTHLARANTELTHLDHIKSLFLSIAAHDLRAPLSAIRSYAELAKETDIGRSGGAAEIEEYCCAVISLIDDIDRLINDLLDLDTLQKGKLLVTPIICDLAGLVRGVCQSLQHVAADRGLEITLQDKSEAVLVLADPERVKQILYNLIGNAMKYTPQGGCIKISCWPGENDGVFQIADNGRGIAPSEQNQVFELYHRSEEAIHSQVRGTGLGLYIVKSLVDAQHGEISVYSQKELGTIFTVRFPSPVIEM